MSSLIERLVDRLPAGTVRLNSPVENIEHEAEGGWTLRVSGSTDPIRCEGLILAPRAPQAAKLLANLDPDVSRELAKIEYAGTSIVTLGYRREQIGNELDGFGFVVPAVEKRRILAGSFASAKFEGRAPAGCVLVRVFIGGACQSELNALSDDQLIAIAVDELRTLLDAQGEPLFAGVVRWPDSMPQYHLGHNERVAAIESGLQRWPGLELAGNAYHGVGVPNCIHSGELAAERIRNALNF